jgi:IPT/TIG domain
MKNASFIGIFVVMVFAGMCGCADMGSDVPQPASVPTITALQPDSAFAGDTLKIVGTNFGATQGSSIVSVGGTIAGTIYLWSAVEIDVKVPVSAVTGNVRVTVGGATSNAPAFKLRGAVVPSVSFSNDVLPVFQSRGCTGCHGDGGANNLDVNSYQHLMLGTSNHGPVVTPGNGEGSVIIKKLRGTAGFGSQMPFGGSPLPDTTIALISLWITQGALNN